MHISLLCFYAFYINRLHLILKLIKFWIKNYITIFLGWIPIYLWMLYVYSVTKKNVPAWFSKLFNIQSFAIVQSREKEYTLLEHILYKKKGISSLYFLRYLCGREGITILHSYLKAVIALKKCPRCLVTFCWVKWYFLSYPFQLQNKNASPF